MIWSLNKEFSIFLQFLNAFFHNSMINFDKSIDKIFENELFETFAWNKIK